VTQAYVDKDIDPVTVGRDQGVDHVLASEYQIADGRIRVNSRLINVSSGVTEAEFRDEQVKSTIFAVQDQVAANIFHCLLRRLERAAGNDSPKEYTTNEEAYRYYWQGQSLAEKQTLQDAEKAVGYLEQAVALDPNYALAYAALAGAHGTIAMSGGDRREHYIKQREALDKALAIDEDLPEAYARLGSMKMVQDWDFDGAERAFQRSRTRSRFRRCSPGLCDFPEFDGAL
jgi:tetratricopeptide (TPR) repeat protein